ncbi:MAG: hypothetical protein IT332_10875 [Ardenticatenales bacterium]|nr:hypothetical protein [Ardenticatenales bacterium]
MFTLYGDHLRHRVDEVWTGSLISLLAPLGLSAQAVRSTLSRMSRSGWLLGRRSGRHSYYRLTDKGIRILDEGAQHLFQPRREPWDGRWHLVTYTIPERTHQLRDRLRQRLTWLGFGHLSAGTWISPYEPPRELHGWLESVGAQQYVDLFTAQHDGFGQPHQLVARAWDLQQLNAAYETFIRQFGSEFESNSSGQPRDGGSDASTAFVRRFQLTLSFLSFPYVDPHLPNDLLPEGWLGHRATTLFQRYHEALTPSASAFVDRVLMDAPEHTGVVVGLSQ